MDTEGCLLVSLWLRKAKVVYSISFLKSGFFEGFRVSVAWKNLRERETAVLERHLWCGEGLEVNNKS